MVFLFLPTGWQRRAMAGNRLGFVGWGLALWLAVGPVAADVLTGVVVGVSDGDTITVLDAARVQRKIRLAGIDAPERGQPFGQPAKTNLSRPVFGKEVDVQWTKHDRYQRIVGNVLVAESGCTATHCRKTLDTSLAQLTDGLAWWYRQYAGEQSREDAGRYQVAEAAARGRHAGLWSTAEPMAPWDWRHGSRGR